MSHLICGPEWNGPLYIWLVQRLPHAHRLPAGQGIGVAGDDGTILAAAWYYNHRPMMYGGDIEVAFAAGDARWATRKHIRAILSYPFVQLGCVRQTAVVFKRNRRVRKFLQGIGFRQEGVHRLAADGQEDAITYGLLASEWLAHKFTIGGTDGQISAIPAETA